MKESLGPQEGLGDLHILICGDILPLAAAWVGPRA